MVMEGCRHRDDRGFTLVELLVATALTLVVGGALYGLIIPVEQLSRRQPEAMDVSQRVRVAADTLLATVSAAGAGIDTGPQSGPLAMYFPALLPRRFGRGTADGPATVRADAITVISVPATLSQTTLAAPLAPGGLLQLESAPNCPATAPLCGLVEGRAVVVFDAEGHFDLYRLTRVAGATGNVELLGIGSGHTYPAGAIVAEADVHTLYFDPDSAQLRHDDGDRSNVPVVDHITELRIAFIGDTRPPDRPRPGDGVANCLFDEHGEPHPAQTLAQDHGALAVLPASRLADGPWCGSGGTMFDADLLRVRVVRVTVRIEAAQASFRGSGALFLRPGTSSSGWRLLPDHVVTFDVAPRNLQGGA